MKNRMGRKKFCLIPVFALAFVALISWVVMALWNNILVAVVHVGAVTFWQAAGIFVLSKILFTGFRGGHGGPWGRHEWKQKMQQKWMNMTPEEKEKFKDEWKTRCGGRRFAGFGEEKKAEQ